MSWIEVNETCIWILTLDLETGVCQTHLEDEMFFDCEWRDEEVVLLDVGRDVLDVSAQFSAVHSDLTAQPQALGVSARQHVHQRRFPGATEDTDRRLYAAGCKITMLKCTFNLYHAGVDFSRQNIFLQCIFWFDRTIHETQTLHLRNESIALSSLVV